MALKPRDMGTKRFAFLCTFEAAKRGWSQRDLAAKLGMSQSYARKIMRTTDGSTVGLRYVIKAIEVFDLVPDYFFEDGPEELSPDLYRRAVRKTLSERVAMLERRTAPSPDDDSKIRSISPPPNR